MQNFKFGFSYFYLRCVCSCDYGGQKCSRLIPDLLIQAKKKESVFKCAFLWWRQAELAYLTSAFSRSAVPPTVLELLAWLVDCEKTNKQTKKKTATLLCVLGQQEVRMESLVSPHTAIKMFSLSLFPLFGLVFVRLQQISASKSQIRGEKTEDKKKRSGAQR